MPGDGFPPPQGAAALTSAPELTACGLSREERLRQQLIALHDDYEARLDAVRAELEDRRRAAAAAADREEEQCRRLAAVTQERDRLRDEAQQLATALSEARSAAASARADHDAQTEFYKDYIRRLDASAAGSPPREDAERCGGAADGEEAEAYDSAESRGAPAAPRQADQGAEPSERTALRAEFERKEAEMTIAHLSRQVARLRGEVAGRGRDGDELAEQNARLQESVQQLEQHLVQQQDLRRELQQAQRRSAAEVGELRHKLEAAERRLQESEIAAGAAEGLRQQLRAAGAEQARLQQELAAAQRRGIAAQRQLDALGGSGGEGGGELPPGGDAQAAAELAELREHNETLRGRVAELQRRAETAAAGGAAEGDQQRAADRVAELERELAERLEAQGQLAEAADAARDAAESAAAACTAKEQLCNELSDKCTQLEQQLAREQGRLADARQLLEMKAEELAVARAARREAEQRLSEGQAAQREERQRAAAALQQRAAERDGAADRAREAEAGREAAEKEITTLRAAVLRHQAQLQAQEAAQATLRIACDTAQRERTEAQRRADAAAAGLSAAEQQAAERAAAAAALEGEREAALRDAEGSREESEWLQQQLAQVRRERTKLEQQIAAAQKEQAAAAERTREQDERCRRLAQKNSALRSELRGGGGGAAALVPLPDHRSLPPAAVMDLVDGGIDSARKIVASMLHSCSLGPLQPADEGAWRGKLDEEAAFTLALVHKMHLMLDYAAREIGARGTEPPTPRSLALSARRRALQQTWQDVADSSARAVASVKQRLQEGGGR
eukprot:TRINITY_DN5730_c0_g4_i1.p1 TRINITY_DN5730_c0_g4~~TRINITY_DN5730_c0_g4_i1.p1  ORF type:complete len:835 (+),score=347.30 TRINITY_DN5730_c0_g4_i1:116-2506(+)